MDTRRSEDRSGAAGGPALAADELLLVEALRGGEESAFVLLVDKYHTSMVNLAMAYVPSRAVAEEVAQEAWLGVLQGIGRFEGRSSLKTWIFRILANVARTRGERENRTVPFSGLLTAGDDPAEASVDPSRFRPAGEEWANHWQSTARPQSWADVPEDRLLSQETLAHVAAAIERLPPSQREIIRLRDIEGWTSDEVCNVLGITETNQRVLLHRARSKVRSALEPYLSD
jgi:RNA polymerase sigma-70 factor (ECF subfamily)